MDNDQKRCFNRINPNRSILTEKDLIEKLKKKYGFNRINPNRSILTIAAADAKAQQDKVSIVSIQTDQS